MPTMRASVNIENVVASATLRQTLDLNSIVKTFPHIDYRPERFPGLVFKLKKPKTATLIFNSGKMVCTGAKSSRQAKRAIRKVIRKIKANGIIIMKRPLIEIVNVVASANLGGRIDLEKSTYVLGRTMYEPEQFPGLIYRMEEPQLVILIFASGKLVCTGGRNEEDVYEAVTKLYDQLEQDELIYYV